MTSNNTQEPNNPTTNNQHKLLDLINDPKTIGQAVEGSMEKRQAVIDGQVDGELESEILLLFRRMSVCAATHQGKDAEWIDGQCVTPSTAAREAIQLFTAHLQAAVREAEAKERKRWTTVLDKFEHSLEIYDGPHNTAITTIRQIRELYNFESKKLTQPKEQENE